MDNIKNAANYVTDSVKSTILSSPRLSNQRLLTYS